MSWSKERDRWVAGNVPPEVSFKDVEGWLLNDPLWQTHAKVDKIQNKGSHSYRVAVDLIGQLLSKWSGDSLEISTVNGKVVKKWIVEQLVKAYEQIKTLESEKLSEKGKE